MKITKNHTVTNICTRVAGGGEGFGLCFVFWGAGICYFFSSKSKEPVSHKAQAQYLPARIVELEKKWDECTKRVLIVPGFGIPGFYS